jgi:hypothetical protein
MSRVQPAPSSPTPRRIAPPSWLDLRLVLGVALVLASVLVGAVVVSRAGDTGPAVMVRRDLAAGTILTRADLRVAQVRLPGHGVYLTRVDQAVGRQLGRAVAAGELVPDAAVALVAARTTVTVPLPPGAAPRLREGQRIQVWVSTEGCSSLVLVRDVTVQAVQADAGGTFSTGGEGQNVVVSVAPELADRIVRALAVKDVQLRAGVLVGPLRPSAAAGADLPDLAPCVGAAPR